MRRLNDSDPYRLQKLLDSYKTMAHEIIAEKVNPDLVDPFAKFLIAFALEDEALALIKMLKLEKIHLAALNEDLESFYYLYIDEVNIGVE